MPPEVTARIAALLKAARAPRGDARLTYFGALLDAAYADPTTRAAGLAAEYLRVMRFLYQKEFVAQREASPAAAVAELYRRRGLSTDTAVEAGYVVHLGLGVLKALEPARRVRRVLIVGPGLDLAPRTGLDESTAPESYQPWAVLDSLLSLGLGTPGDLEIVAADINPRVVAHLARAREHPPLLRVATSLHESPSLSLSPEYRDYVDRFGGALSAQAAAPARDLGNGQRGKTVSVSAQAARALRATPLDIVTQRLDGERFDLIIATNILPYFDDPQLALAVANIAAMLAPGGVLPAQRAAADHRRPGRCDGAAAAAVAPRGDCHRDGGQGAALRQRLPPRAQGTGALSEVARVGQSRADPSVSVTIRFASTSRHVSSRPFGQRTTTRSAFAAPARPTWTRRSFCEK